MSRRLVRKWCNNGHQHAVRERGNAKAAEHVDELGRCVRRVGTDLEVGVHPVQGEALVSQVRPEDGPLEVRAVEPGQGVEPSAVKVRPPVCQLLQVLEVRLARTAGHSP